MKLSPKKKFRLQRNSNSGLGDTGAVLWQLNWELVTSSVRVITYPFVIFVIEPPVSFIAQLVEHCSGVAQVVGSNPVQA